MTQQCNNCIKNRSFSFFLAILELDDCVHALAEKREQGRVAGCSKTVIFQLLFNFVRSHKQSLFVLVNKYENVTFNFKSNED